jgi:hypothetical protein
MKVGLCDLHALCVSVCLCVLHINFRKTEVIFIKVCMRTMELEPILTSYFINLSHQSVCLYTYTLSSLGNGSVRKPPIVSRQRLDKNVTASTNTHAKIEEYLDASYSMRAVSYQEKQAISSS